MWQRIKDDTSAAADDARRLWWELDWARFEIAAAHERTSIAREERADIEKRFYILSMNTLPGGKL